MRIKSGPNFTKQLLTAKCKFAENTTGVDSRQLQGRDCDLAPNKHKTHLGQQLNYND